ncbi:MAG TPA: PHB depolymerase family esterase [Rubrivivax sp.]|nr:PHB depolymerase family esterase [Rubrivivax sp.]
MSNAVSDLAALALRGPRIAGEWTRAAARQLKPPRGRGDWLDGVAIGAGGARHYCLYRPPDLPGDERLPLLVMLHGCTQTARGFALSTRMNLLAARERFFVLYPEQDRLANAQGCWNWYDRRSGIADAEAATLMAAVDQACAFHSVDRARIAVAGLSAGASMAALLATRYPQRFKAVAMHSGVAPGAAKSAVTALGAMSGRHAPPLLTTAVGKAMGAAAVFATLPPLLVLHGAADAVVSASNAARTAAVWAMATAAKAGTQRTLQRGKSRAMRITDYKHEGRTLVSLCEVEGLGHAWSGGAPRLPYSDAAGPSASRLVWAFAAKQFTARKAA